MEVVRLDCSSGGAITITGTTTSATVATISAGVWYRATIRCTTNATSGLKIDGGTEQTVTANNQTMDRLVCGRTITTEAVAFDCYYDDISIDTSADPGPGNVVVLRPNAAGTYTGWASGTGTTFAEVDDDVPGHDSDTTYVKALATDDNTAETFGVQDGSARGVHGVIKCVKGYVAVRTESTASTSTVGLRMRSGSTDSDNTGLEWSTSYVPYFRILDTDPSGGAAWTAGGVDGVQIGVFANTIAQAQRFTAGAVMVWSKGQVDAVTATATADALLPSVQISEDISAVAATATADALTPVLNTDHILSAVASTASADAPVPTLNTDHILSVETATATADAPSPTISIFADKTIDAVAPDASADAPIPTLSTDHILSVVAATATADALAPVPNTDHILSVVAATATSDAPVPALNTDHILSAPAATATADALATTLNTDHILSVLAAIAVGDSPGPVLNTDRVLSTPEATANVDASIPTLSTDRVLGAPAAAVAAESLNPGIETNSAIDAPVAETVADGIAPGLALDSIHDAPAATATADAGEATFETDGTVIVSATVATAQADATAPALITDAVIAAEPATAMAGCPIPGIQISAILSAPASDAQASNPPPEILAGRIDILINALMALASADIIAPRGRTRPQVIIGGTIDMDAPGPDETGGGIELLEVPAGGRIRHV